MKRTELMDPMETLFFNILRNMHTVLIFPLRQHVLQTVNDQVSCMECSNITPTTRVPQNLLTSPPPWQAQ